MNCRHCEAPLKHTFLDLGFAPPSNAYLTSSDLTRPEKYYPLKVMICDQCWLAQTEDYAQADELFDSEYAYFSSTSTGWLAHASAYAKKMIDELHLSKNSFVIEVASNDGYLLKNFVANQIPCLGIEPTASTAAAAEAIGIPVLREFFGERLGLELAENGKKADLIAGNNVYAHVPDINDFVAGIARLLKPTGRVSIEFPHLLRLLEGNQFDTIYHEHYSYLSLRVVQLIAKKAGLEVVDVEEIPTHGGSLRVWLGHQNGAVITDAVERVLAGEAKAGLESLEAYRGFQQRAEAAKHGLLEFLLQARREGKRVLGYGAAAKGNTLLNYTGVRGDLLPAVADRAVSKQGKLLPGSHIPVISPEQLEAESPDAMLVLPWNLIQELREQIPERHLITAIPTLKRWQPLLPSPTLL